MRIHPSRIRCSSDSEMTFIHRRSPLMKENWFVFEIGNTWYALGAAKILFFLDRISNAVSNLQQKGEGTIFQLLHSEAMEYYYQKPEIDFYHHRYADVREFVTRQMLMLLGPASDLRTDNKSQWRSHLGPGQKVQKRNANATAQRQDCWRNSQARRRCRPSRHRHLDLIDVAFVN